MIEVAVCDDEPFVADGVKKVLEEHTFSEELHIETFQLGQELYASAVKKRYDLIIMDIELTEQRGSDVQNHNGMLLADRIKDMYPQTLIIFFSGHGCYMKDLLHHEPFGFVGKPLFRTKSSMCEKVEQAIMKIRKREVAKRFYIAKKSHVCFPIKLEEIIYIESKRPKILLVMFEEIFDFRGRLSKVEKEIEELDGNFVRVSQSFLVNVEYIKVYTSKMVKMVDGSEITVSRKYTKSFMEKIKNYNQQC